MLPESHLGSADLWKFVTAKLREGTLVPVIGPGVVTFGPNDTPLYPWLLQELAKIFQIERTPESLHRLVCQVRCSQGPAGEKTVRSRIDDLLAPLATQEPSPLMRALATLPRCPVFLTLGFDPLFESALRKTWPEKNVQTWDSFKAVQDLPSAGKDGLVLGYLFGKATATPAKHSFNLWEADALEFAFQLQPMRADQVKFGRLGDTLARDLLFLGADLSDWALRFLLRIIRNKQLSDSADQELFLAERDDGRGDDPVAFFTALNNNIYFQQSDPVEFARALCAAMSAEQTATGSPAHAQSTSTSPAGAVPRGTVFISYSHEDKEAAFRIADTLNQRGLSVWIDRDRIGGGSQLEARISDAIRDCAVFISVISRTTERSPKSYAREERYIAAAEVKGRLPGFYFPVIIDSTPAPPKAEPRIFWDRNMPLSTTTIAAFATDGRITPDFIDRIFQYLQDQDFETP